MRSATYSEEQIIEAGAALVAEGKKVTGFSLREKLSGGNPARMAGIWERHSEAGRAEDEQPEEMPKELAAEIQALAGAVADQFVKSAARINHAAGKSADRRATDLATLIETREAEAKAEIAAASGELERLDAELATVGGKNEKLEAALEAAREEARAAREEAAELRGKLAATQEAAALLREQIEKIVEKKQTKGTGNGH